MVRDQRDGNPRAFRRPEQHLLDYCRAGIRIHPNFHITPPVVSEHDCRRKVADHALRSLLCRGIRQ
jgi:hypothetical protein